MNPVLYYDQRSPPVRSVLMLAKMLDIDVDLKLINLFKGEQLKPWFKELNPAHTVPCLIDAENDLILTDSHAILMHLCSKHPSKSSSLWPQDYKERIVVTNMLFFEASVLFRRDSEMMSDIVRMTHAKVDMAYHRRKIYETYDMCEVYLRRHKFLASDCLTIADISAVTTISTVDLVFPVTAAQWPSLAQWLAHLKSLPEYGINERGLQELKSAIEEYGKFKCCPKEDNQEEHE